MQVCSLYRCHLLGDYYCVSLFLAALVDCFLCGLQAVQGNLLSRGIWIYEPRVNCTGNDIPYDNLHLLVYVHVAASLK